MATSPKISANRPDIMIHDKKRKEIMFVEVGVTSQDQISIVENEKKSKYDVLANDAGAMHGAKTKIILFVLTWNGIVTKFHEKYVKEIGLTLKVQAYIQYITLKKTLESISFEYRRGSLISEDLPEIINEKEVEAAKSFKKAPEDEYYR